MHYDAFGASSKVVFAVSVEVVLLALSTFAKAMPTSKRLEDVLAIFGKFNYFCHLIS